MDFSREPSVSRLVAEGREVMVDRETASAGVAALAVAIAEIVEDVHDRAVTPAATLPAYGELATELRQTGFDIATLAQAMEVLVRRGDPAE